MSTVGKNVKMLRKEKHITTTELGEKVGVAPATISRYENGKIRISHEMIEKLAKALQVSPLVLMGYEEDDDTVPVQTLGEVAGGIPIDSIEDRFEEFSISKALAKTGNFATFMIKGNSMSPKINDGDVVLVRYGSEVSSGDVAIVYMYDYQVTCKKVYFLEKGKVKVEAYNQDVYATKTYNKNELQEINFQILGKVILVVRSDF